MNSPFENLPENNSFYSIIKLSADILMIFIPPIGYIFQALKFKQTKSSKGFAKFLCLLLLLANILRIFFWFGKKFSLPLLFKAILVIISQIYLIHAYLEYQEDLPMKTEKTFREYLTNWKETLNLKKIWDWNDEIEYFKFILFIILILSIICSIFGTKNIQFFEILGTLSVSCETFIELPQIKENCMAKNTKNLSGAMVLMWFVGDLFKTTYNLMYKSPIQMIIGGIIMNCEDIILSSQVLFYNEDSFLNKVFQKRPKYVNLDEVKDSEQNNKLDFDTNIG
jgi:uncharacterized protein with PQ loop repeat